EPMSMLKIMDRHTDWAVLICLIGGGQEIHTGEAGLREWGRALEEHFLHWHAFVSPQLQEGADGPVGQTLLAGESPLDVTADADLHLGVSIRCFRTTALSRWVENVLGNRPEDAMAAMMALQNYPIVMTRSLAEARSWLQSRARGLRRCGLVASSGAKRLRRFGVDVDGKNEPEHWFLADHEDVRSSTYLEVAATEFDIQGLEVDWAGLCWDADLRRADSGWRCMRFRGTRWENIRGEADQQYLLNKYRVLLTRAREGVVIWVPPGDARDAYSLPAWYDELAGYLTRCGVTNLSSEPALERSENA
ncbi:MAG: DNA/RNA helicase domain-containing protein, partial [Phycisphaeraceae bacterium]